MRDCEEINLLIPLGMNRSDITNLYVNMAHKAAFVPIFSKLEVLYDLKVITEIHWPSIMWSEGGA
jgi:hypothetical protein